MYLGGIRLVLLFAMSLAPKDQSIRKAYTMSFCRYDAMDVPAQVHNFHSNISNTHFLPE